MRLPLVCLSILLLPVAAAAAPDRVPSLLEDLRQDEVRVRLRALRALGNLGTAAASAVPALEKRVTDERGLEHRAEAARALVQIGPQAVPALQRLLQKEEVRSVVLAALTRMGPDASAIVPLLRTILAKDSNPIHRIQAATILAEIGPAAAAASSDLLESLCQPNVGEALTLHRQATLALVRIGRPALPVLITALQDRSEEKRARSAHILALLGREARDAIPALVTALRDRSPRIQRLSATALAQMGSAAAAAVPELAGWLGGKERAQAAAIDALAHIGTPAVDRLAARLRDRSERVRTGALIALRRIGPPADAAVPALIDVLPDKNATLRRLAALALGGIGPRASAAIKALERCLQDTDASVRLTAALALTQIQPNDAEAFARLERVLREVASLPTPARLAAVNPLRQAEIQRFVDDFILAGSFRFRDALSEVAKLLMLNLGPDAIPILVRTINRQALDPVGKEPILVMTPQGIGERTFYFI